LAALRTAFVDYSRGYHLPHLPGCVVALRAENLLLTLLTYGVILNPVPKLWQAVLVIWILF